MRANGAVKIILSLLLAGAVIWLSTNARFYSEALVSPFFALALASVILIHLRLRPSWQDAAFIAAGALLFAGLDLRVLHFKPAIMAWTSFAGLSSLLVFGLRTVWAENPGRKLLLLGFVPALFFVGSEYFADDFLHWTSQIHPSAFDLYLFSFDSSLRVPIPFWAGQAFSLYPKLFVASLIFYIALPVPIALIYAGRVLLVREKAVSAFLAFLGAGPLGVVFYNVLPALGPAHLFGKAFPWHPLTTEQAAHIFLKPVALAGPPNAIPSLHMAWVLLVWWYSRGLAGWERAVALAFLFFTVLATLGTGEHYFIDLIVAFPFALLVESLCSISLSFLDTRRLIPFVVGLFATLGWLLALRFATAFFWHSPVIPWSLCFVTVTVSVLLEKKLWRAAASQPSEPVTTTPATQPDSVTVA
jgi:hypothetical protein